MTGLRRTSSALMRLLRDCAGNVLPMTAIGIIVLAAIIGGGVDMSRGYMVKSRLQAACDAGVLAGRRAVTTKGYDTTARARANTFFAGNYDDNRMNTQATSFVSSSADGNTIRGTAATTMNMAVMQLFGFKAMNIPANCSATMGIGNSDVVMVLDTTGSMACTAAMTEAQCDSYVNANGYSETAHGGSSRMRDLRNAMREFRGTLATSAARSSARIRYGFVPYSSTVNVGRLLKPEWIADRMAMNTRDGMYSDNRGNLYWRHAKFDGSNAIDVSNYKRFNAVTVKNGPNAANRTYTWSGCIEERSTTAAAAFAYSTQSKSITPYAADLDLDLVPTNDATRWKPYWPERTYLRQSTDLTYYNESTSSGYNAPGYCPPAASQLASLTETAFNNFVNTLVPSGATYHDIGMIWGGRLMSKEGLFAANVNESAGNAGNVSRHLIFMTDGQMKPSLTAYSAYGVEYLDRRVTSENNTEQAANRHNSRFLAVCAAVRGKGVRVWVIAFASKLNDELTACASADSAFVAANSDQLNERFQAIAKEVGELRVVQ